VQVPEKINLEENEIIHEKLIMIEIKGEKKTLTYSEALNLMSQIATSLRLDHEYNRNRNS